MVGLLTPLAAFTVAGRSKEAGLMGSLIDELQCREAAARAEAEELRGHRRPARWCRYQISGRRAHPLHQYRRRLHYRLLRRGGR